MRHAPRHVCALAALAAALWAGTSCQGFKADPEFLATDSFELEVKGNQVFTYDAYTCQTAFNRARKEFRVHTDTMSDYYCLTLESIPSKTGEKVKGDITWTGKSDVVTRKGLSFTVKKVERNQMMWLWCRKEGIGVVIQVLNQ